MKKRAHIVSGLAALAALFLAPIADASLTRATSAALEPLALAAPAAISEPSVFSLFEGTELAAAAAESERPPSFHPLAAVSLLSKDGAEPPLVSADELSYPKTRYRVFGLLGTPILGELRGVSLELHWRSASFSCGLTSGTVGWLSQDPLGDRDSPNLYGFVGARPHEKADPLGLAGVGDCGFWCSLGGYWKGVGTVAAAPGVLTYNLTGALLYATTPEGHRERYREQYEATRRMGSALAEDPLGFVAEGVAGPARKVNAAIESGDVRAASEGLGNLTGQIATVRAGTSGASVTLAPAPALAGTSNAFMQAGGALVMTAPPYLGGASVLMATNAANQNAAGQSKSEPRWKEYEQRHGGQQTTMETRFRGRTVKIRLDKPPSDSQILDFKDYDWSNPRYQDPFIQGRVTETFTTQIAKYKTVRPNVHFQFSAEPPQWVIDTMENAGGTYSVVP
jgi:hypothetical protein